MVRGSGHDPVTSESKSTKVLYDGTIERWDAFKMHIRSSLHQKGLWLVVKEGPQQVQVPPAYEGPNTQPPDAGDYYYTLQDMVTQGPVDFRRMLHIINCFKDIGNLNPDTILIHHKSVTNNQWEKWSEELTNKIAVQGALVEEIQSVRLSTSTSQSTVRLAGSGGLPTATPVSGGAPSSIARSLDFGSPSGGPTITSARDREIGQQREPTVDADNAAFHVIVQYINAECSTGMMLLLDIETRFDEDESGHRLYKYLSERASCGASADGLTSADEQRNKIRDWQFCPNETITIEALVMGSTHFKRMWTRQPKARQGMGGDMFDASVDSSWQVHDKSTRSHSTTGMVFFWHNGPISVRSSGQRFQAISSTDAESHGLASAMYEGICIRGHGKWAGVPITKPTRLENDNSGAVLISRDASSMHNSRASAMRAVFCQECVEQGMFDPVHVSADKMTADVLTKWLSLNSFSKHRSKLTNRRAQTKLLEAKAREP